MDIILIFGGIVLAYFVTSYFWKKLPKDPEQVKTEAEPVAPYKVEPPVETVVVEPVVAEVKIVAPELKIVTGSAPKTKKPVAKKPVTPKAPVKASVKNPVAKKSAKPRIKKPTDNA